MHEIMQQFSIISGGFITPPKFDVFWSRLTCSLGNAFAKANEGVCEAHYGGENAHPPDSVNVLDLR